MNSPHRYDGRPILVIIENYALRAIGKLPDDKDSGMMRVVRKVWGGNFNWVATVREQLGWDTGIDESIRRNWLAYQQAAKANGLPESAEEFAMMFADEIERRAKWS